MIIKLIFGATLWYLIGAGMGWYIGNQGGFHRGVKLMTTFFVVMMEKKDIDIPAPPKYTDL